MPMTHVIQPFSHSSSPSVLKISNSIAIEKEINSNNTRETNLVFDILNEYESIFHSICKMKDVKVKLAVDESVTLVAQQQLRVRFHLCDKVDNDLKRLFDAGFIEPVKDTSVQVAPVVTVLKEIQMKLDCALI